MRHVGYDADTETHTYRDLEGNLWESKPGNQYGPLKMTYKAKKPHKASKSANHSPISPIAAESGEKKGFKDLFGKRSNSTASNLENPPPPPYSRRSRRFTSFNMLDRSMVTTEDQIREEEQGGVLGRLGRSLSTRKNNQSSGRPQRRSTLATSSVTGRWRSGTV
jgi:hypothetical protein